MKKLILLILLFSLGKAYAQQPDHYYTPPTNNNTVRHVKDPNYQVANNDDNQVHIVDSTQEITADILPYKSEPKIKNDRYYFWYLNNIIHSTQGGYSGQLLNGHYLAFYPDKNLKEEGDFKKGLKDGEWKAWNPKGDLTSVANWNEGLLVPDNEQPFWKKTPFFKKKDDQPQAAKPADGN